MYSLYFPKDVSDKVRDWCSKNCVGYWRETEDVKLDATVGILVGFSLENEGDAMRAELTFLGKSALTELTNDVTPDDETTDELTDMATNDPFKDFLKARLTDKPAGTVVINAAETPAQRHKRKFLAALDEQTTAVEKELAGDLKPTVERPGPKKGDPKRVVELAKWYYKADGIYYTFVRYGTRFLPLADGKSTLKCGPKLTDVKDTLLALRKFAEDGKLDKALEEVAKKVAKADKAKDAEATATETEKAPEPQATE